jgi:GWxTD domain-containing protein
MKTLRILLMSIVCCICVNAMALTANLSYNIFYHPQTGSYIETNLLINAATLKYQKLNNGNYQGFVNITIMFMKGEEVANFSKIRLGSPVVADTMAIMDFLDHQQFQLPDGKYDMIITMADEVYPDKEYVHKEEITLDFATKKITISSIELLNAYGKVENENSSKFIKNGYELVPKETVFYSDKDTKLSFYTEIYHTEDVLGKEEAFLVSYYLQGFESKRKLSDFSGFKRMKSSEINSLLVTFLINDLKSGNYELFIDISDKNNNLLTQKSIFIQRSNSNTNFNIDYLYNLQSENMFTLQYKNLDTLRQYVNYLYPLASYTEKQFIFNQTKPADLELLQRFLYNFWTERDELNPEKSWIDYLRMVLAVNKEFRAGRTQGYQTDRGRVYLQYGPPSVLVDRSFDTGSSGMTISNSNGFDESGTIPYQIWQYDVLGSQRNKTFVFANIHIAAQTYDLIHSDAQGEIFNPQWQSELSRNRYNPELEKKYNKTQFEGTTGEFYHVPY